MFAKYWIGTVKVLCLALVAVGLTACEIDQTQEGKLPSVDVDVDAEAGRLPRFDIEGPDVNVGLKTTTVNVPKLVVVMEEQEVRVPYVDVDVPGEDQEEQTVAVEAEVRGEGFDLKIQEAFIVGDELWVVSTLNKPAAVDADAPQMRISDRIILNAPDLRVRHFVIGDRPTNSHNDHYKYISSRSEIKSKLANGRKIYSRAES